MENAFYYLYETTNETRKEKGLVPFLYDGQHCTHNLNDGYYGSHKSLIADIKKGDKYTVRILEHFTNIFDLGKAECAEIKLKKAVKDPNYYNNGNGEYFNYSFEYGRTQETKNKISKNNKSGTIEIREKLRNAALGKPHPAKNKRKKGEFKHSEETIQKMRLHKHSEESKKKMSKAQISRFEKNSFSKETRKKLSESLLNVKKTICAHCNKEFTPWGFSNHQKKLNKNK